MNIVPVVVLSSFLQNRNAISILFLNIVAGSLFQLFESTSTEASSAMGLGFLPRAAIVVIGTPLSIYLLYAAITKATAETEADDQAFLSGK
jgi:hypothetical protein